MVREGMTDDGIRSSFDFWIKLIKKIYKRNWEGEVMDR